MNDKAVCRIAPATLDLLKIYKVKFVHFCADFIEEVSMKWMDRPSVTEIDRGGVNEMDRQTKFQKMEMPQKCTKFL